ncbi:peptidase S41 [Polaribacter reichenbachii]|uniref:Tricorn protease homolog n=1 Tax=Polaribacter reichenbachii TaxID=996801 RepID=A0A1B8U5A5_9FLAO|nr:S41 family peptidase [Polaribacter reichenbachii]APZ47618.1 peptidase S41 [Polaribacter reichenbachii]AUC18258.1 peptidase S41 [Polaribacter reichenbachii]OBY67030.1 peptidase S41 [Polaribacter reichenbachii]
MRSILLILTFLSISIYGQDNPQWMRHSAISPDGTQIAFTYKGDLYKVSANGGTAKQLTYHNAHDYKAVWSKDGSKLAFASNRYGNFDIYTMNSEGGAATRLTFHSNDEIPFSFSSDDKNVVFGALRQDDVNHRQYPSGSQSELYSVPVTSGRVSQIFTIPAEYIQYSKDGQTMLYHDKKGGENEWRKHHTSSITRDIWLYDAKTNSHKMITTHNAEDRHPFFTADEKSMYYLSERSGSFNIHKMNLETKSDIKLTNFSLHPVRFLSVANGIISFGYDGELYTMKEGASPKKLAIKIITQDKENTEKFIAVNGGIQEMAVSPNGKEIAFIARGEVFVTSVDKSFTKRLTNTPENERFVSWGPEGKSVVYSSERNGKWSVFKSEKVRKEEPFFYASTLIKESTLIENKLDNYLAEYSPDGKKIAFIEGRRTLKIIDVASKKETTLLTPEDLFHMRDGDKYFTWSSDSKWLLVDWSKTLSNSEVLLMAADGSKRINLNESGYYDYYPKWVNGGKQMLWFSNRNGLKSYATSGRSQSDVYSMFFTQEAWDEFNLSDEEYKLMQAIKEEQKKKKEEEKKDEKDEKKSKKKDAKSKEKKEEEKTKALEFDWANMKDRTKRLTIHSSSLGDAVLSKKGDFLYYLASFEGKSNLWSTNLRTRETKMLMPLNTRSGSLQWDKEMKNLYLLSSGRITKLNPASKKQEGVSIKGEILLDEYAERKAMFDHVWIRTNAIFYHPDFHGINWGKMKEEYQKYLPHISNGYEFSEMLSEMLGELNVSHAGARYSGSSVSNADATASLGVFMNYDFKNDGILIDEIISGGPLDKAKFKVEKGNIITKIDGVNISKDQDIAKYLNRKSGKFMLLEILDPKTKKTQTITVKPISLGQENRLLYNRWVKINEKEVAKESKGQLGYVHIPGMSDGPYRSIYQDMMGKYADKKGVIIDTRFNGGGDLVADLAMFFTGVPFITYATEAKVVGGEPTSRWTKPTLSIFNESMYSDGHCYASGYTDLKIGKTVGMPVPGTCSFAGWEGLQNGGYWGVVPVSAKNKAGEWMENNQTEPTIKVKNMPGKVDNGIDEQLMRSIQELLKDVN